MTSPAQGMRVNQRPALSSREGVLFGLAMVSLGVALLLSFCGLPFAVASAGALVVLSIGILLRATFVGGQWWTVIGVLSYAVGVMALSLALTDKPLIGFACLMILVGVATLWTWIRIPS